MISSRSSSASDSGSRSSESEDDVQMRQRLLSEINFIYSKK